MNRGEPTARGIAVTDQDRLVEAELNAALADNLVRSRGASDWGQIFLAAVTAGIFWPNVATWVTLSWLGLFVGVSVAKTTSRRPFLAKYPDRVTKWIRLESWVTAAMWSVWASLLVGAPDIVVALLLLIYAGLISIGASTLVGDRTAFQGFVAILLAPVTLILLAMGLSWGSTASIVLIALYVPLMLYIHRVSEQGWRAQLLSNIRLRRSESEAARRTRFLDALMARAPNPIVVLDREHRVVSVNPAFERVTGYPVDEVNGQGLEALLAGEDDRAAWSGLLRTVDDHARAVAELTLRHAGGEPIVVRFSAARGDLPADDNVILMGEDVTEQVRAREASEAARVAAETATLAKSAFLASMSHEVRTPLHGIMGMIRLLLDTPLSDDQRRNAEVVRDSADHLLTIVNDILDVSKIEAGQLSLTIEPFDLHETVRATGAVYGRQAQESGTRLDTSIGEGVPQYIKGDRVRIGQILGNLLSNAVKFTDKGRVSLTVELEARTDALALVHFAVRDTGIGIPADHLDHVFREFAQVAGQAGRLTKGTGLGLTIASRLARLMSSEIRVESVEGEGSTFSFVLPLSLSGASTAGDTAAAQAPPPEDASSRATPVKILLAEDNVVNQQVALAALRRRGYEVDLVQNGREAADAVARGGYDLVLMDVQMPELDGIEATREIRRTHAADELPIVALTAHAFDDERRRCLEAGMNDFLSKPFMPADLHAGVERWLARSRRAG